MMVSSEVLLKNPETEWLASEMVDEIMKFQVNKCEMRYAEK